MRYYYNDNCSGAAESRRYIVRLYIHNNISFPRKKRTYVGNVPKQMNAAIIILHAGGQRPRKKTHTHTRTLKILKIRTILRRNNNTRYHNMIRVYI